ncbi:precorrin-6y C5,15-methyltransferase (decarboxylating) subunit CbiE [Roseovarius atlanticus]|uniref:precorrin-6y C5,15-methyltransferase (decarboxylating) subunit CbiE n=1 Tax=Roseovarius atlanticus TaxID=1641875 RepID=UPI001C973CAF|nr:precorrin-6y C5,15-methyltransferase (decarboxylating) subunit CbiE [Roseovarius atlanticus]MBY5989920.1 precorrin-6y C5,15-methyltransferase (decarboxylating) subunit CbiE [Roseovarius atlanticus]MBY6126465.1 precorrin-6y C5,15-methyltransferase (decarboxylating) subunit CbiE [Roseovarius atlanticus]MBY6150959.1 precorrin-6y C5,15-methyltransferase (decarboxylating) subunit CbiE [Roseovarius atlanticus]
MSEAPWLTIIGLGEDGPDGLCAASRSALEAAEIVMGPQRHLSLIETSARTIPWPVPFAKGVEDLLALRGTPCVVLASGDPFWFGAGTTITGHLDRHEWHAYPGRSTFSLAANRLGWPLDRTICTGLHAAPLTRLRPHLSPGVRLIVLLRDGDAVTELAAYLHDTGFGTSQVTVMEALGGPRERMTHTTADALSGDFAHPVCAAIEIAGNGPALPRASGLPDTLFETDGVMTKRHIRALTLSTLAPRPGEHLWDIGGGSGTIGIEWLLCDPTLAASVVEPRADRIALINANARALGVDRLHVVEGSAPAALKDLPKPDAVFIGGGLSSDLLTFIEGLNDVRIVANAVTLESEALLADAHARRGGELHRFEVAQAQPMGRKHGWTQAYPITQWSFP